MSRTCWRCCWFVENPRDRVAGFRVMQLLPGVGPASAAAPARSHGTSRRSDRRAGRFRAAAAAAETGRVRARRSRSSCRQYGRMAGRPRPRAPAGMSRISSASTRTPSCAQGRPVQLEQIAAGYPRASASSPSSRSIRPMPPAIEAGVAAARRGLSDPLDHPLGQGPGMEIGVRAQRGRRLHPVDLGTGTTAEIEESFITAPCLTASRAVPGQAPARGRPATGRRRGRRYRHAIAPHVELSASARPSTPAPPINAIPTRLDRAPDARPGRLGNVGLCNGRRDGTIMSGARSASNQEPNPERGVKHMSERGNLAVAGLIALSGLRGRGLGTRDQAHARRPEFSDRVGSLACAAALGEAGRGGDQGPRKDRGLSIADPDQGRGYVEGHAQRHRRYRLVRARLLARADAVVGRHVPSVPAHHSAEKGSEALWKLYEKFPAVQKEFSEIQPLVLYTSSPNLLVSRSR